MTPAVFDASVVVKWFVADPLSPNALACRSAFIPHAPAFLAIELANVFWKYERTGALNPALSAATLSGLSTQIDLTDDSSLLPHAHALTAALDHSVYDCLYVALAMKLSASLITADRRLIAKLGQGKLVQAVDLASIAP